MPYCSESPSKASAARRVAETSSHAALGNGPEKQRGPDACSIGRFVCSLNGPLDMLPRALDLTQMPFCQGEEGRRRRMISWASELRFETPFGNEIASRSRMLYASFKFP